MILKRNILLLLSLIQFGASLFALDVKEFGAVGDGRADDTAAIKRAIDKGGHVVFPKGNYRITKTIVINLDQVGFTSLKSEGAAKIIMAAAGPAFKFIGTNEARVGLAKTKSNIWDRERMPLVDGLSIQGDHAEANGIEASGTIQFTITRTHIRGVRHGIHLTKSNRNVVISDCHIYANHGIGIFYDNVYVHQSNITGCHISYNKGGGVVSRAGDVRNIQIGTCDLEFNMGTEGPSTANILIDAQGSIKGAAEIAIVGCTIQHTFKGPDGANIRIIGSGDKPDESNNRKGNITIANNVLSDVQTNIDLRNLYGVAVTGNTMWRSYQHSIRLEGSEKISIASNVMGRNPRYSPKNRPKEKNAVLIRHSKDVVFNGNILSETREATAGLTVENSRRINITDNNIVDCDGPEVHLKEVTFSRVSGCILSDSRKDHANIKTTGSTKIQIKDNLIDE